MKKPAEAATCRSHRQPRPLPVEPIADGSRCWPMPAVVVARIKPSWTIAGADQASARESRHKRMPLPAEALASRDRQPRKQSLAETTAGQREYKQTPSQDTAIRNGPPPLRPSPRVDGRSPPPPRAERAPPAVTGTTPPSVLQFHPANYSHLGGSQGGTEGARREESMATAPLLREDPSW